MTAKRRSGSSGSSSNKAGSVAPTSRTNAGPKPKGRVPTSSKPRGGAARSSGRSGRGAERGTADEVEVVDAGGAADATATGTKPPYGANAVLIAFLTAQVASMVAFVVASNVTDYDFSYPTGVGAAVGQASAQAAQGVPLDIALPPPLWLTAIMQLPMWLGLGAIPVWFAVKKGRGVVADLGLRMKAIDVPVGLAIGVAAQLVMVPLLYWILFQAIGERDVSAEARALTDRATDPLSIVLVFVVVAIGAPLAEEIYYRGLALRVFARRVSMRWATVFSAFFFAVSHLQFLQLPALFVLGLILGAIVWRTGRLGMAIWAHVGFNTVTAISLIFSLG